MRADYRKGNDHFKFVNVNPKHKLRAGDCVIRAIAFATGAEWENVYLGLTSLGFTMGDVPNAVPVYAAYLKNLGLTKSPSPRKTDGRKYTLLEFAQEFTKSKGTYVIKISNHLTCVQNGYICDTWDCSNYCVGNYWKIK